MKKNLSGIAFMGTLNEAYNENGIIYFVNNTITLVLAREPETELYIIGDDVTDRMKKRAISNIILTSRMADIKATIGSCEVFIAVWQRYKDKNLEAMAMGNRIGLNEQKFVKDNFLWFNAENAFTKVVKMITVKNKRKILNNVVSHNIYMPYATGRVVA